MRTTLSKWGNSYGVRIPRTLIEEKGLCEGSTLDVTVKLVKNQPKSTGKLLSEWERTGGKDALVELGHISKEEVEYYKNL